MKTLKGVFIGLGRRGRDLYKMLVSAFDGVEIVAVCDLSAECCERAKQEALRANKQPPKVYSDHKKCIDENSVDFAIVCTSWVEHLEVTMYAMERGLPVGCEVVGAYSMEQLWNLVHCYERTKTPVMFLENCCYGRKELMALKMKRLGVLGEIVHCQGGYLHDLQQSIIGGNLGAHYRYQEYLHRNCENYPTHEIGPLAMILDINRGNRFTCLYSMASKAVGLEDYIQKKSVEELKDVRFNQGDVITTVIKCQNGETVRITLDTTLPRFKSLGFYVQGTKGLISEETDCVYIDGEAESHVRVQIKDNIEKYYARYDHSVWKKENKDDVHGGIDFYLFDAFFNALQQGEEMPIDVYDMVTWMSITILSEQSIATGMPVAFPDFTNGKWVRRKNTFALEE